MTNPLKIEVTEAMRLAAKREYLRTLGTGDALDAALTAAFQHPEFRRQLLAQLKDAVPENAKHAGDDTYTIDSGALTLTVNTAFATGYNCANDIASASLGRLLGEG